LGTLGLILQVSLKVLPRPIASSTRVFEINQEGALRLLNQSADNPAAGSQRLGQQCAHPPFVGRTGRRGFSNQKMGGTELSNPEDYWTDLREQTHPFFADPQAPLWRLSVPSVAPPIDLPGAS
jgi:glycolate oxidase FAD binding subunit